MYDELDALGVGEYPPVQGKVVHEHSPRAVTGLPELHVLVLEGVLDHLEEVVDDHHAGFRGVKGRSHQTDGPVPGLNCQKVYQSEHCKKMIPE